MFGKKFIFSIGITVSNGFFIIAPVITSIAENFGTFFIAGLSPAAIVLSILNCLIFFLLKPIVSLELTAYPSKAELFAAG